MSIKLDLSKFKHISSDDKSTTLEHKDGHRLCLAHGGLSKDNKKQLEALAKAAKSEEPVKMAEGGKPEKGLLERAGEALDSIADKSPLNLNKTLEPSKRSPASEKKVPYNPARNVPKYGFDKYAEGGEVEDDNYIPSEDPQIEEKMRIENALEFDPYKETRAPKAEDRLEALMQDPELDRIATAGQMFDMGTSIPPEEKERMAIDEMVKEKQDVAADAAWRNVDKTTEAYKQAEENKRREAAGLAPIAIAAEPQGAPTYLRDAEGNPIDTPAQSAAGQAVQGLQPSQVPAQQPQAMAMPQGGIDQQLRGIDAEAAAKGALGNEQARILQAQQAAQQEAMGEYKSKLDILEKERQLLQQDIKDGHVDPEKFWTGDKDGNGGHSKLMAGIGMIIAGFNPTSNPNMAIEFLNKQMDANLKAQQANLNSKESLLKANLQQFGNLKDAQEMTRIQMKDMLANQLDIAAAKAASPMAKAAAMQAKGKILAANQASLQKLGVSVATNSLQQAARQDPTKIPAYLAALDATDPKAAAAVRERVIPGIGLANTTEGAKGIREMGTTVDTVKQSIQRLKDIASKTGKSLSPSAIAEADTIRSMLIGQLRVPITGPGAMSEGERMLLEKAIPDVTSIFSLDSSNMKRLDTIADKVNNNYKNMLKINGLDPSRVPGLPQDAAQPVKGKDGKMYIKQGKYYVPVK